MALVPGQRLGIYEVVSAIGKGGMGEVYRARDTKLQREVAIKVLPESLATDRDRLARFEREAQLLAALNHPHIAAIYGVDTVGETEFLVLELVDGDTLADRITRGGAFALSEALAIGRQIAEALQAAHDKGIIHRDLKPANIALTSDNHVKVLDFGLAKAMEGAPAAPSSAPGASLSPTLSLAMTEAGFILGTAAYMSPEQAKGRPADKRSDVWAFGCVLFEMLTGKRAFEGEDASDTLAGILRGDPDWKALPRATPVHVREILTGCLAKDRKQRLADIAVVSYLLSEPRHAKGTSGRGVNRRAVFAFAAVALVILAAVIGGLAWALRRDPPAVVRFTIVPPPDQLIASTNSDRQLALSADGSKIVYVNASGQLVVRYFGQENLQVLQVSGTAARSPFWSPDGKWIGYTQNGSNELRKVSVTGGPSVLVTRLPAPPRGASWGPDDSIVFATADPSTGLMRVPAGGGEPEVLTKPDVAAKEQDHALPSYLPGGHAVLFAITAAGSVENSQVAVLDLTTRKYRSLIRGGTHPQYVNSGHLVYSVAGSLRAVGFDLDALAVTSDAVPVTEQVGMTSTGATQYAVSETGTLVYMPGGANGAGAARSLVWVDRKGLETPVAGAPLRSYTYPRLSHDNSRLAVSTDDLESDIVVFDFALRTPTKATFGPALDAMAAWYPGDERFLFVSARDGNPNLYAQRADGIGGVERLTYSKNNQFLPTMSPDGKLVVVLEQRPGTGNDLVLLRLDDSTAGSQAGTPAAGSSTGQRGLKSEPFVDTQASEIHPEISPDGRWLAYVSGESGKNEVFVMTFPDRLGGKWQVSTDGGSRPAWSPAGSELFYVTQTGAMMSVRLEPGPGFKWRNPVKLFDWPSIATPGPARTYDLSRDGRRFLMIKEARGIEREGSAATIRVVLNWVEELKAKLPQ
jgi:eukaryotic-like serine/threonine-protein kinase